MVKMKSPLDNPIQSTLQLKRALSLVWQTAPKWTLINVAISFLQGALPLVALYVMKRLLDAVMMTLVSSNPGNAFHPVVFWILAAGGVAVLISIIQSLGEYASEAQSMQVTDAVALVYPCFCRI